MEMKLTRREFVKRAGLLALFAPLVNMRGNNKVTKERVFLADIGWLRGSMTNGVRLSENAKRDVLEKLDGAMLFNHAACVEKYRTAIGRVVVISNNVFCYSEYDISNLKPALEITAVARRLLIDDSLLVEQVDGCGLFVASGDFEGKFTEITSA